MVGMIKNTEKNRIAYLIMCKAHKGQLDKGGEPYYMHPFRVAFNVSEKYYDDDLIIIAYLHDVVEDSEYEFGDLLKEGIPEKIVESIKLLTRNQNMSYEQYIDKLIESNDINAIIVKQYDLEDNMNITRLKELSDKDLKRLQKYHKAYRRIVEYVQNYYKLEDLK